jgi:hypothetical protein
MPKLPQDRLRRPMTALSGIRRRIQKLGPYQSLICNQSPLRGTTFSGAQTEAADDEGGSLRGGIGFLHSETKRLLGANV